MLARGAPLAYLPIQPGSEARVSTAEELAELAPDFLTRAAEAPDGKPLEDVRRAVEKLCATGVAPARAPMVITFRELAERWTSGALARQYPDHVREKRSAEDDRLRFERHVYPVVGEIPLAAFTLDHAEAVMQALPPDLSPASRRHIAQLMHRVLSMAVFPLRLVQSNPLPRGFLPSPGAAKAKAWLYPDEDSALLGATSIPLCYRLLYGFLAREGMRAGEAAALTWGDLDLKRGAITLDTNKTDEPRAWAMSEGTVSALRAWRERCGSPRSMSASFSKRMATR
jgi:integrase